MRKPVVRVVVGALLLGSAVAAGLLIWDAERRAPVNAILELGAMLDPLVAAGTDLGLAHAEYLVDGSAAAASIDQVSGLLRESAGAVEALSRMLQSEEAIGELHAFADATAQLAQADARAREYLAPGDTFGASRVLMGEARDALVRMREALAGIRRAETRRIAGEHRSALTRAHAGLAVVGAMWVAGVILLVPLRRIREADAAQDAEVAPASEAPVPDAGDPGPPAPVALPAFAALCSEIARVDTTDGLSVLLDRAAALLGASGVVLWVGAGEELFPVMARGYDAKLVQRIGPVSMRGENATAAAWRTERMQVVQGSATSQGAIVAPVCNPSGCVAVLAVEVPSGREADAGLGAVVTVIAAQLASLVSGWPGASVGGVVAQGNS